MLTSEGNAVIINDLSSNFASLRVGEGYVKKRIKCILAEVDGHGTLDKVMVAIDSEDKLISLKILDS
jgi:hypothetical protein